jgi:hypothetical protein
MRDLLRERNGLRAVPTCSGALLRVGTTTAQRACACVQACVVVETGGGGVTGAGLASPLGHTHTKPSRSTTGSDRTRVPLQKAVDGIFVQAPSPSNSQPWYAHCTWRQAGGTVSRMDRRAADIALENAMQASRQTDRLGPTRPAGNLPPKSHAHMDRCKWM